MTENTRRVMLEACNAFTTTLAYGYTDSSHDEFDLMCDKLRHAHITEEAVMNGEEPPTFEAYFLATYGHEYSA
jgi:hypothetical protein